MILYVKDTIPCKRRQDLEIEGLESIWLELKLKNKVTLLSVFYRPPNSNQAILDKIERSVDLAFDTNIPSIIITGDFNLDFLESSGRNKLNTYLVNIILHN